MQFIQSLELLIQTYPFSENYNLQYIGH